MSEENKDNKNGNQEAENGSTESQNQDDKSGTTENQNQSTSTQAGSVTPEFKHPALKGKTPEEIERLFSIQQDVVNTQKRALDRVTETRSIQDGRPDPNKETPITDKDFFDSPAATLNKLMDRQVGKLRQELSQEIRTELRKDRAPTIRERFAKENPEFRDLEPMVDEMLRAYGMDDPSQADETTLDTVYSAVYGKAVRTGRIKPAGEKPADPPPTRDQNNDNGGRVTIPQHRPSSAPLPKNQNEKPKLRELDENERRLAREYFGHLKTDEERHKAYIEFQEMDEEEVPHTTVGKVQ